MIHHWTENEELLDRYAMGRMDAQMKSELDRHIADCPDCQKKLEAHRSLAGAVRAFGRLDAKDRLKSRINARKRRSQNVVWMMRAAAVFVVFIGVGLYNRFWQAEPTKISEKPIAQSYEAEAKPTAPAQALRAETERDRAGSGSQGAAKADADQLSRSSRPNPAGERSLADAEKMKEEISLAPAASAAGAGAGQVTALSQSAPKNVSAPTMEFKQDLSVSNSVWAEGTVVPGEMNEAALKKKLAVDDAEPTKAVSRAATDEQRRKDVLKDLKAQGSGIIVRQFTPSQQKNQQMPRQQVRSAVLALFEFNKSDTTVYVNMQPPLSKTEEASVQVGRVSQDSLLLHVRNLRIGYKIPSGSPTQNAR